MSPYGVGRRSLRARYIDTIRYGVSSAAMRREGRDKAIYNGLYRTALAALNAGWDFADWHGELSARGSVLGAQVTSKRNGQDRPRDQVDRQLMAVWAKAEAQANASPAFSSDDRAIYIAAFRTWLSDPDCPVARDSDRRVLDAIARRAAELNVTSPPCPRAWLMRETGLGCTAVDNALRRLTERGLLTRLEQGRQHSDPSKRTASVYRLARPETLPALTSAAVAASGAPPLVPPTASGAPPQRARPTPKEDPVNLTEMARANAEIQRLKEDLKAEIRAEVLAAMGVREQAAPVRHLRPVPTRKADQ